MMEIPKLTGIEEFRLSDKTSTQANNATRGLAKKTKLLLQAFEDEDRQRSPRKQRGTLGKTRGPGVGNSYAIFGKDKGLGWGIPMQFWASLSS